MINKPPIIDNIFTSFVSVSFSLGILGVVIALALKFYVLLPGQVTITGILSSVDPLITEIYTYYALNGRWPNKADDIPMLQDDAYIGSYKGRIILDKGSLHVIVKSSYLALNGKTISFRKAVFPEQVGGTTFWLCGYKPVPAGMVVDTENRTNIDKKYMIARCK